MLPTKSNFQQNLYLDKDKIPEEWFMPISYLNSDYVKTYMDEEERKRSLRVTLEAILDEKKKERRKK